jgi:hypothetical protein
MRTDPPAGTTTSTATGTPTNWEESPSYGTEAPLPRLAQAEVTFAYEGDLQATGECRYLFRYGPTGDSELLGFEQVEGTLRGRAGSFALRHEGTFTGGKLLVTTTVVPGSGGGELDGLTGSGTIESGQGDHSFTLRLDHTGPA